VRGSVPEAGSADAGAPILRRFEEVFVADHRAVVAIALALSGSRPLAEDLAQEAFLRAHQRWATIGTYENPGAWVRRVAINLALSDRRRRSSERRAIGRLRPADGLAREGDSGAGVDSAERFWAAVRSLPSRQRAVVVLRYVEDRSVGDIAEVLDVAEGTVKAHLHKARAALGRRLAIDPEDDR
jgi:RNA polymerase sigma-70 factor (ECF subfamily)